MFQLPPAIVKKIWEYDPTYRDVMNICLLELQYVSPYWGLKVMFENQYYIKSIEKYKYDKFYMINKNLTRYWNYNYKKNNTSRNQSVETKHWTYNEFICDVYPKMHNRIFRNIKNYKFKMYGIDKMLNEDKYKFYNSEMGTKGKIFNVGNHQIEFKI